MFYLYENAFPLPQSAQRFKAFASLDFFCEHSSALVSNQLHLHKTMGKTKYAVMADTAGQNSLAKNPYSVQKKEAMPTIPKANFSLTLEMTRTH